MALFDHTDKMIDSLPDLKKEKKLSNLLGTNKLLNKIRSLPQSEFGNFRLGALALTLILGASSYYFYWREYQQRMKISSGYYKLLKKTPINAGNQFFWDREGGSTSMLTYYYRMPKKEFDIKYRLRSAFISGEFDHDKEILLPTKKNGVNGYTIITPFYYYQKNFPSIYLGIAQNGTLFNSNDEARGAMAVKRGWYIIFLIT
jgi:hypothetical protein